MRINVASGEPPIATTTGQTPYHKYMHTIPEQIRAVCFDAVGTLLFPSPPAHLIYAQLGANYGSWLTAEVIRERFAQAFAREETKDQQAGWQTSEPREVQRWQKIVSTVLADVSEPERCFQELYSHFAMPSAWKLAQHTEEVLRDLEAQGYTLVMASNYDHRLHSVVAGFPALKPLSHLFISSEIGWRKPAAEFFAAICQKLELPPQQILFIGDDLVNDYQGATNAGLSALLYSPGGQGSVPAYFLTDFRRLLQK